MVFSSISFIFYFLPLFFLVYFLVGKKLKNPVILLGSIAFYAWGAPKFIFVILGTTAIDFYLVRYMSRSASRSLRTFLLCISLSINLGLLFYFKYANFFIQNVNVVLSAAGIKQLTWIDVILPIGISFYTFETLTYVVDVYRRLHKPLRNFWDYQLYIILFPKLIAGPIVRYHDIEGQIYDRSAYETSEYRLRGLYRFFIGLGKKVLIANIVGAAADTIFSLPAHQLGTATAWWGALSYTFQIYFDFSGYSDMALGLALMMGFRLPENFDNPYTATSITDFWRRWHISLGNWMRHYLYIPLGGNRVKTKRRLYFNLWIVFLISGLWHGAAWGFVIWGAYHGIFLVLERVFLLKWLHRIGKWSCVYTFFIVLIGWVFFRVVALKPSLVYLQRMFTYHAGAGAWQPDKQFYGIMLIATFFSFFTLSNIGQAIQQKVYFSNYTLRRHFIMATALIVLCVLSTGHIAISSFNPFIYFRF